MKNGCQFETTQKQNKGRLLQNDERAEFNRRRAQIEKRIAQTLRKSGQRDLEVLSKAGLEPEAMCKWLAFVVDEETDKTWPKLMRLRQEGLKSIARRMGTLARDAEEHAGDPFSQIQRWFFSLGLGQSLGMEIPKPLASDPFFPMIVSGMRILANRWTDDAHRFGRFLKRHGDVRTNMAVPLFLCWVCARLQTRKPQYWTELANVLTDAFEANGKNKRFSADWLQKLWKRRGRHLFRFWEKRTSGARLDPIVPPSLPSRGIPGA